MEKFSDGEQWNSPESLQRHMSLDPWFVLALICSLTPEQWLALARQQILVDLLAQVQHQADLVLRRYPKWFAAKFREDIAVDVMIKLKEGKFLKRYNGHRMHPKPYVIGCAYQYARTVARSYLRRFGH